MMLLEDSYAADDGRVSLCYWRAHMMLLMMRVSRRG